MPVVTCPICSNVFNVEKKNGYVECDECDENLEIVNFKAFVVPEDEDFESDDDADEFDDEDEDEEDD